MSKIIKHYGTKRHSGRYPWGSGEDPEQRDKSFLGYVNDLKKRGISDVDIAKGLGMNTSQLRAKKTIAKSEQRKADAAQALKLKNKGYSNVEIGRQMGRNESSIRSLLDPVLQERAEITRTVANMLKDNVEQKKYVDVGLGIEQQLGISRTKLKASISLLEEEGYRTHRFDIEQVGTGKKTNMMVLTKEDVTYPEILKNKNQIKMIDNYSEDGCRSILGVEPIKNIDSKRIQIRYHEDGGSDKDGVIELRRGVDDISLGNSRYAQVRIGVDGTHFLKGMAMYNDDMPKGVDIIYNTNKHVGTPPKGKPKEESVFKSIKDDVDNPFGSTIRQKHYIDREGKEQLSALNIVGSPSKEGAGEEGSWGKWSKNLSSQILSKQRPSLAKQQLGLAYKSKQDEFNEIMSLNNRAVKKKLLDSFADDCDSSSVHLKAAALPRQMSHIILPIPKMRETEVYAPNYRNGERVVLIRHPHGGTFEIPELVVNNRQKTAKSILGDVKDAVGINPKVAAKLSGADFDGDTVIVIPNSNNLIKTSASLKGLMNFDPKESYRGYKGMPKMSAHTKGMQMGNVSNLITDMTIKGADTGEIARAVRHSMVVIDAEKHNLDYKRSFIENGIGELKRKYQGRSDAGASTLISKASSKKVLPYRKEEGKKILNLETGKTKRVYVDRNTGEKLYEHVYETYVNRQNGKIIKKTTSSKAMIETNDAFTLSSGTPMETIYATYANKLKALANEARKISVNTSPIEYSQSAKITYTKEVASLKAQLNLALKNKPLERQAQLIANANIAAKRRANPDMSGDDLKKIKDQALTEARLRIGAKKQKIDITDKEWEAIQAGAISNNTLLQILNNADSKRVKELATPRTTKSMTPTKIARAKAMLDAGCTRSEIADRFGVSISTITNLLD